MGYSMPTFKCPHCDAIMGSMVGPNGTAVSVDLIASPVVILSCIKCLKAIGAVIEPNP